MKNESRKKGLVKKKTMHFLYGAGGAVVIVGALFKILHLEYGPLTGSLMLSIGLGTEAFIFLLGSIDFSEIYEAEAATPKKQLSFLEESSHSRKDDLDFLSTELNTETESLKKSLHNLNDNVDSLNDVYGGMVNVIKKN